MDLHVFRSPETEITVLAVDLSLPVCVRICLSAISITQKKVTAETSNLVFYICIIADAT